MPTLDAATLASPTLQRRRATVAKALKRYLEDHKMTVRQFNESVLGVKPGAITPYNWISGRNLPGPDYIARLSIALGKPESFFRDEPDPHTQPQLALAMDATGNGQEIEGAEAEAPEAGPSEAAGAAPEALAEPGVVIPPMPRTAPQEPRKRSHKRAAKPLPNGDRPLLTCTIHGNGTATLSMHYTTSTAQACRVMTGITNLGVDVK